MKKQHLKQLVTLLAIIFLFNIPAHAQAPQKMSYQAVIYNAANVLLSNTNIGMRVSILQNSINGTPVYVETHATSTNSNGLVDLEIGTGTVQSGSFATIDWASTSHYIKTETDPTGGTAYTITGASQLLTVPYSFYAETSGDGLPSGGTTGQILTKTASSSSWQNQISTVGMKYYICVQGIYPAQQNLGSGSDFLSRIVLSASPSLSGGGAYLQCNGQLLQISQYSALFSLIGTTYGGNGMTTFALPNLNTNGGAVPIGN